MNKILQYTHVILQLPVIPIYSLAICFHYYRNGRDYLKTLEMIIKTCYHWSGLGFVFWIIIIGHYLKKFNF